MRVGQGGGNARRGTDPIEDGRTRGQKLKEGLSDLKDKTGEKLGDLARDTKYAVTHPKETAVNAGSAVKRKATMTYAAGKTLAREPKIRGTIPEGLPKPPIGGKLGRLRDTEPVGPNYFESLSPEEQKGKTPNYPVSYSIPVEYKSGGFTATGKGAGFSTGPGLLPQQYRVPGRFDYEEIPNVVVGPNSEGAYEDPGLKRMETAALDHGNTVINRHGKNGLPSNPETGMPVIPKLPGGSYSLTVQSPVRRSAAVPAQPKLKRIDSDESLFGPERIDSGKTLQGPSHSGTDPVETAPSRTNSDTTWGAPTRVNTRDALGTVPEPESPASPPT